MASVDFASFESVLSRAGNKSPVKEMKHIIERDRTRAQKLINGIQPHGPLVVKEFKDAGRCGGHGGDKPSTEGQDNKSVDVTDCAVTYIMSVGIGEPATFYKLLIDTGSSNTWVGSHKEYKPTKASQTQRNAVSVTYGSGSFVGTEYTDTVTLSPNMVIRNQSIGVAKHTVGFENGRIDGILGIGPVDLTRGTVDSMLAVPTITGNMQEQGLIETESIGIYYAPTPADSTGLANGEVTFGGVDETKITTPVKYVPVTKTFPASRYWGIDQTIKYSGNEIMNHCAGIVDTGTTLTLLATDTFEKYRKATGAVMDSDTGLLCVTAEQFKNMKNLEFHIGGNTYELTPNAQIWPRSMNEMLGGDANKIYLVFADMGQPCGSGLDFINGFTFLQRFYSVYDTTNSQIGFAETKYTRAETN